MSTLLQETPLFTERPLHYQTVVLDRLEDFEALADEWQGLLARADERNLALDHPWLVTWLKHFPPQKLCIILVLDETGTIIAAAPFQIGRSSGGLFRRALRRVQFIGTDPCVYDWIRIVIDPKTDETKVLQVISNTLIAHRKDWDLLDLRFNVSKEQLEQLGQSLHSVGMLSELEQPMAAHALSLPGSAPTYHKNRKRNLRKSVQRRLNRLQEDYPGETLVCEVLPSGKAFEQACNTFIKTHIGYWKQQKVQSDFNRYNTLASFYKALHNIYQSPTGGSAGRYWFSVLKIGSQALAYQVSFVHGKTLLTHLCAYNTQFKQYCPGTLHVERLIHHAIEAGLNEINLGRGDEPYKLQWSPQAIPLWSLRVFAHHRARDFWHADHWIKQFLPTRSPK